MGRPGGGKLLKAPERTQAGGEPEKKVSGHQIEERFHEWTMGDGDESQSHHQEDGVERF